MDKQWKVVPVEADDDMEVAAENDYEATGATFPDWKSAYRAMLAAAPQPPSASDEREALAWYAEQAEGCRKLGSAGDHYRQALDADGGKRARAALAHSPGVDAVERKPVAWRYKDARGNWRYTGPMRPSFSAEYSILKPEPLYAAPSPAASADEWMAEAERLVHDYADAMGKDEAFARRYEARAALLAHLKVRP